MNYANVFFGKLKMVTKIEYEEPDKTIRYFDTIKPLTIFYLKDGYYIDLETNLKYYGRDINYADLGQVIVDPRTLVPYSKFSEYQDKPKGTKRGLVKRFQKAKSLINNNINNFSKND